MKRHGNLWPHIVDIENLRVAHQSARKGKAHYTEVQEVDAFEYEFLTELQAELVSGRFTTSRYEVEERFDGRKLRTIHKLPYYPDRIVQHALIQVCEPIWKASFIRDTFQSITQRGTHDAKKRVEKSVRGNPDLYALKFDIQKYYPSVDNEILKAKVRRKIKCLRTLRLIDDIVDSNQGLPIGNYTSQYLGNVYLSGFDWWVKQTLAPLAYFRYCDDLVVLGRSAAECHKYRQSMFTKLDSDYRLMIKGNWQVFPVDIRGLDFVGFVFRSDSTRLRRGIAKNFEARCRAIRRGDASLTPFEIVNGTGSYWGWCKAADAKKLWQANVDSAVRRAISRNKDHIREMQQCA
jgi:hypothetical protein